MENKKRREEIKQEIEQVIKKAGFDLDDFIIGSGAHDAFSEIHYQPKDYDTDKDPKKEYSIQFCDEVVAIWEIGKRCDKHASIDLKWEGVRWRDIHELKIKRIGIKNDSAETDVAVMPFQCFEAYLLSLRGGQEQDICGGQELDIYYRHRVEGDTYEVYSTRYERKPELRQQAIALHGTKCQVCGFSFADRYGDIGEGYIEVHHIKPLSEGLQEPDPRTDLVCLCANCHRMIHKERDKVMSIEDLKARIKRQAPSDKEISESTPNK